MPTYRFNPAPGWPATEESWIPPRGWKPDPSWPAAPENWNFWVEVRDPYQPPEDHIPKFELQAVVQQQQPAVEEVPVHISPRREEFNGIPVVYTRQQQGHSVLVQSLALLLFFIVGVFPLLFGYVNFVTLILLALFGLILGATIYYTKSPNHYWRL